ncbi:MAG: PulJ/GspJ family protein [Wolinella sp.]
MRNIRNAFTMVELVFTVVILGVIGVAGSQAVHKITENYILQRSFARLELETHRVLTLMSQYLEHALWESIYLRNEDDGNIDSDILITWVSKDMDNYYGSFDGTGNTPRFSGVVKLEESGASSTTPGDLEITTLGSRLDLPRNSTSSGAEVLFLPSARNLVDHKKRLQTIKTTTGTNRLTTTPQSPSDRAKELHEITHMVDPNAPYSFSLDLSGDLVFHKGYIHYLTNEPGSEHYFMAHHVKDLKFWFEGEGSILRIRLCMKDRQLFAILGCKEQDTRGICATGFCKESAVIQ